MDAVEEEDTERSGVICLSRLPAVTQLLLSGLCLLSNDCLSVCLSACVFLFVFMLSRARDEQTGFIFGIWRCGSVTCSLRHRERRDHIYEFDSRTVINHKQLIVTTEQILAVTKLATL